MKFLTVDKRGRNTLPESVRRDLGIGEEDTTFVLLEKTDRGTYELVPAALVPKDQLWFHHPEMERRVAEAEADFREGRSTSTSTVEEAQAHLDRLKGRAEGTVARKRRSWAQSGRGAGTRATRS
jgi:bifunctional DNA-binding transcriptional regulator/antitoxin component of YhaV-PrlF toxin-antitoxin module